MMTLSPRFVLDPARFRRRSTAQVPARRGFDFSLGATMWHVENEYFPNEPT